HENIRRLPVLRHHPEWIGSAELYFHRYGAVSLLVGRYIGPLRPMLPTVAGMLDMPFGRFIVISMLAAAGWSVAYLLPGWATGAAMRLPLPEGFWGEAAIVAAGLAALLGPSIYMRLHGRRQAGAITASVSLVLLLCLFFGWPHLTRLDQGLMALIQEQRLPAFDPWVVLVTRMGDFNSQLIVGLLLGALLLIARQWRSALF